VEVSVGVDGNGVSEEVEVGVSVNVGVLVTEGVDVGV
jgi:hypothetical protein